MTLVGLSEEERRMAFFVLAVVLLLGEIDFEKSGGAEQSTVVASHCKINVERVAERLGVKPQHLEHVLTQRTVSARASSMYSVPLSLDEAETIRGSLAKLLYAKLFAWLVKRMNELLSVGGASNFANPGNSLAFV